MEVNFSEMVKGLTNGGEVPGVSITRSQALTVRSIDVENRRITALASTQSVDRHGEVILPEAFKESIAGYMRNPVILAAHRNRLDSGQSPIIASCIKAWVDKQGLWVTVEFHDETALAREYWGLYSKKIQRAFSVGFIPKEWHDERDESGKYVRTYSKVELLEISCVPIPSNRESLSRAARKAAFVQGKRGDVRKPDFSEPRDGESDEAFFGRIDAWYESPAGQKDCDEFTAALLFGDDEGGEEKDTDDFSYENFARAVGGRSCETSGDIDFAALVEK